jgi:hypothetical protein
MEILEVVVKHKVASGKWQVQSAKCEIPNANYEKRNSGIMEEWNDR